MYDVSPAIGQRERGQGRGGVPMFRFGVKAEEVGTETS